MPTMHAKLGPSSASRWITCPGSIRLSEKVPKQGDSPYAAEGTMAHELGEIKAAKAFGLITSQQYGVRLKAWLQEFGKLYGDDPERLTDMQGYTDDYVDLIRERMALYPSSTLLLEQRVETGVDRCWGTSDVVIVSPQHVEIIDLKYGAGVPVDAHENPQLMLYGVGALDMFGDVIGDTQLVRMTVFQPRLESLSTYEMHPVELRRWRDTVVAPAAEEALGPDARVVPSDKACRWCPAAGWCKVRMEQELQEAFGDSETLSDPDLISADELGEILPKLAGIKSWCDAVSNAALDRAYSQGEVIPGHKVVQSGGKRSIPDAAAAIQTLIDAGIPAEKTATFKLKGIGELEKLVGSVYGLRGKKAHAQMEKILGNLIVKGTGSPSLVPEEDKREAISPASEAAKVFADA